MQTPIKTTYIGRDIRESELPRHYQNELFFYACFFDGHWLAELTCQQITFVGCYFAGESELSSSTFEKVSFKNCFFCEPFEIHIGSDVSDWKDVIDIHDDSDCHITIYQNNKRIAKKTINILPRQFKQFVSIRHFDTDLVYEQLKEIYHNYIQEKRIDCLPIFSGLTTEACDVVKRDALQFLLDYGVDNAWHKYIMQLAFHWSFDIDVMPDISFVSQVKPSNAWHVPSFSRILSNNWFDITDGLKSILRCIKLNPALLESLFYDRIKYLTLHHDTTSVVSYCIQILMLRGEEKLLKNVIEKRSELIQQFNNPDVLALINIGNLAE